MGPNGPLGQITQALGWGLLSFSFWGLLIGSVIYSLPFVVQPLINAFEALGQRPLEAAATLRAGPLDAFWHVALPLARPGYLTGAVMGFAPETVRAMSLWDFWAALDGWVAAQGRASLDDEESEALDARLDAWIVERLA